MGVFVSDLRHVLDLPDDAPRPAKRIAEHLAGVVRAATGRDAGLVWVSALSCTRRSARRACPGFVAVVRVDVLPAIEWRCTSCGDEGTISGWERSPFDLRPTAVHHRTDGHRALISPEVAATLRTLTLLDIDGQRFVFRAHVASDGVVLDGTDADFGELLGCVAAEADREPGRRRRQRLDAARVALQSATRSIGQ